MKGPSKEGREAEKKGGGVDMVNLRSNRKEGRGWKRKEGRKEKW